MNEVQKIGIVMLAEVKTTGRRHYVRLDPKVIERYGIKIGDVLKLEILEVARKPREKET